MRLSSVSCLGGWSWAGSCGLAGLLFLAACAEDSSAPLLQQHTQAGMEPVTVAISAPTAIPEGDSGAPQLSFPVVLSAPSTSSVVVHYSTEPLTATENVDYTAIPDKILTFSPGELVKMVQVTLLPDNKVEPDETVRVRLSSPTGATIGADAAIGTILDDDAAPVATPRNLSLLEDIIASGAVAGTDADDGPTGLTFARVTNGSKGSATINSNGGFIYIPNADATGADSFTFTVSDGANTSAPAIVSVTIAPVNDAPRGVTAGGPYTVNEGSSVQLTGNGNDTADNNTNLTYTWDFDNDGQFDDATGRQPSYPGSDGPATITVRVRVSDGQLSAQASAAVNVINVAPDVTALAATPSMGVLEGDVVAFSAVAADPGDPILTYTWSYGDSATDQGSNLSQVSHSFGDEGSYTVRVTANDGDGGMDTMTRTVNIANAPPTFLTPAPTQAGEGQLYRYEIAMRDPGVADTLTWTLIDGPEGMIISSMAPCSGAVTDPGRCRVLTWTPTSEQVTGIERQAVTVRVADGDGGRADRTWDITLDFMDTDGGGAPDSCEAASNYNPSDPADDTSDTDMDGRSLLIECQLGTDPRVSDAPGAPFILSPRGFAVVGGDVQLKLTDTPEANDRSYAFEVIALDGGAPVFAAEGLIGSSAGGVVSATAAVPGAGLEENGRYLWRARSFDGYGLGAWSTLGGMEASFLYSNLDEAPPAPVLLAPRGVTSRLTPDFELGNVEDPEGSAVQYDFELLSDEGAVVIASAVELAQGAGAVTRWSPGEALEEDRVYRWRARANDLRGSLDGSGPWSDLVEVRVNSENSLPPAPALLYPAEGQLITSAAELFVVAAGSGWDADNDAISYTVRMGLREDLTDAVEVAGLSPELPPLALPGATGEFGAELSAFAGFEPAEDAAIYVEVFGSDGQVRGPSVRGRFRFSAINAPPAAPLLLSPLDGERVDTLTPLLTWVHATDPEGELLRYDAQLSGFEDFSDLEMEWVGLLPARGEQSALVSPALEVGRSFWWRVRAVDPQGAAGPWSVAALRVRAGAAALAPPALLAPEPGRRFAQGEAVVLSWGPSVELEGAPVSYRVRVLAADGTLAYEGAVEEGAQALALEVPGLAPGGYVWSVAAVAGGRDEVTSARRVFSVEAPRPELLEPAAPEPPASLPAAEGVEAQVGCSTGAGRAPRGLALVWLLGVGLLVWRRRVRPAALRQMKRGA